jgi:hypothetical protein
MDAVVDDDEVEAPKSEVLGVFAEPRLKKFIPFMIGGDAIVAADVNVEAESAA